MATSTTSCRPPRQELNRSSQAPCNTAWRGASAARFASTMHRTAEAPDIEPGPAARFDRSAPACPCRHSSVVRGICETEPGRELPAPSERCAPHLRSSRQSEPSRSMTTDRRGSSQAGGSPVYGSVPIPKASPGSCLQIRAPETEWSCSTREPQRLACQRGQSHITGILR